MQTLHIQLTPLNLKVDKSFYTVTEAARALEISKREIEDCLKAGKIMCYTTPGGHRKIPKSELERLSLA